MGFLARVEARTIRKLKKIQPLSQRGKEPKSAPASGASGEQVGFSQLTNTRKLTPFIAKELQLTDPFDFKNETWTRFTQKVAPKLLVALLLDMNIVPVSRKMEFARYLERRLRSLSK